MPRLVVFTDLDGTLLDAETYSFSAAREALALLRGRQVPLILVSSKTRAEMEPLRSDLGSHDPFIVENGAAVYIPKGVFDVPFPEAVCRDPYLVVELGAPYALLRSGLREIEQAIGRPLRGFGDMSAEEVAERTGLSEREAVLAKQREYDEPFLVEPSEDLLERIGREAETRSLRMTRGGRFCHLSGRVDKGEACRRVVACYARQWGGGPDGLISIALGDGPNDLSMLVMADRAVVVPRPNGAVDPALDAPGFIQAPAPGPRGWNRAVLDLVRHT